MQPLPRPHSIQQANADFWVNWRKQYARYLIWYDNPLTRAQASRLSLMLRHVEGVHDAKRDRKWQKIMIVAIRPEALPELVRQKLVMLLQPSLSYEGRGWVQNIQPDIFELTWQIDNLLDENTWTDTIVRLQEILKGACIQRDNDKITTRLVIKSEVDARCILIAFAFHIGLYLKGYSEKTQQVIPNS